MVSGEIGTNGLIAAVAVEEVLRLEPNYVTIHFLSMVEKNVWDRQLNYLSVIQRDVLVTYLVFFATN